jgi:predicted PurR-regulated permease PerM
MQAPSTPSQKLPAGAPASSSLTRVVVAALVVVALYFGREVLMPITLAMLLSFVLTPLVELLRRLWLGRIISVLLAVILALAIIVALGLAIGTQVARLSQHLPQYQSEIEKKVQHLQVTTVNRLSGKLQKLDHQFNAAAGQPSAGKAPASMVGGQERTPVPVVVTQPPPSALRVAEMLVAPFLAPVATAGIILVVTIFTLLQKEDLRDRAIRLFGSNDLRRTTFAMNDAGRRLSRYFLTQLGINTTFGVVVAVGLHFIGVPNPVLWGIMGALLRFVPYVGSWIAALFPMLLAAAVAPGWSMMIYTAVLYAATELTMGQMVEPLVYGHTTGLSPLAVIIAAIFWTWIWGPVGLIISTPLTLCLVVVGRHAERLKFLDVLLGDRPALSPSEGFYQRILADDTDEVEAQAERYLSGHSLSSYYDDVALKGLALAANDVARETLSLHRIERVKASINDLIEDLDKYDDDLPSTASSDKQAPAGPGIDEQALPKQPPHRQLPAAGPPALDRTPAWQGEHPVLCIAGRGPLDEAAAGMLAQLLGKRGLGARVVPYEAVSRSSIKSLDPQGVAMACVSYVDIGGNPAHLRYLLLRLRKRLPQAQLLVGLWPAQDSGHENADLRREAEADYCVTSLRDAVAVCVAEARGQAVPQPVSLAEAG